METADSGPIKTAMVLAAGFGTRMRPLTDRVPKPLLRLAGRALIDHALDRLAEASVERAVVNVHHFADQIEAHLRVRSAPRIIISDERQCILETGGGVRKALPHIGRETFIVHNSDSVWSEGAHSNLKMLIAAWDQERMNALLLLAPRDASIGYAGLGDFHRDAAGHLKRRIKGEDAPYVFAGVSILKSKPLRRHSRSSLFLECDLRPGKRRGQPVRRCARRHVDACGDAASPFGSGKPLA